MRDATSAERGGYIFEQRSWQGTRAGAALGVGFGILVVVRRRRSIAATPVHQPWAFVAAAELVSEYFASMAKRVYVGPVARHNHTHATILARWILRTRPTELHVRHLQREVRLRGMRTAGQIREAAEVLVTAGWLRRPAQGTRFGPRVRVSYAVNPKACC